MAKKFFITILLIFQSAIAEEISAQVFRDTIYENAEDTSASRWSIYDQSPIGAVVTNEFDYEKNSYVIRFDGDITKNGYMLGDFSGKSGAWNNTAQKVISWDSKFDESFVVYVNVMTNLGQRYIVYRPYNSNFGIHESYENYINLGIGSNLIDGKWHSCIRDLESDLKVFEPENEILTVNGFLIRGSGMVDNITLKDVQPTTEIEDAENIETVNQAWSVYDKRGTPYASITQQYDLEKTSNVISFTGAQLASGYRIGNNGGYFRAWNNTSQKSMSFDFYFNESLIFYVSVDTLFGQRYLTYRSYNTDLGINGTYPNYIDFGIGEGVINNGWQSFNQNLENDLKIFEPNNKVISTNGLFIRGNGKIDDLSLSQ